VKYTHITIITNKHFGEKKKTLQTNIAVNDRSVFYLFILFIYFSTDIDNTSNTNKNNKMPAKDRKAPEGTLTSTLINTI